MVLKRLLAKLILKVSFLDDKKKIRDTLIPLTGAAKSYMSKQIPLFIHESFVVRPCKFSQASMQIPLCVHAYFVFASIEMSGNDKSA